MQLFAGNECDSKNKNRPDYEFTVEQKTLKVKPPSLFRRDKDDLPCLIKAT